MYRNTLFTVTIKVSVRPMTRAAPVFMLNKKKTYHYFV